MRNLQLLESYRVAGDFGGDGIFRVPSPTDNRLLTIVASTGLDWDHVSVSQSNRCPNWPEMDHVKHMFFRDDETVMQLHVPSADHVNNHPYCLHLWRPQKAEIPRPAALLVGDASLGDLLTKPR